MCNRAIQVEVNKVLTCIFCDGVNAIFGMPVSWNKLTVVHKKKKKFSDVMSTHRDGFPCSDDVTKHLPGETAAGNESCPSFGNQLPYH